MTKKYMTKNIELKFVTKNIGLKLLKNFWWFMPWNYIIINIWLINYN